MTQESDAFDPKDSLGRLLREVKEASAPLAAVLAEIRRPIEDKSEALKALMPFDPNEGMRAATDEVDRIFSKPANAGARQASEALQSALDRIQAKFDPFSNGQSPELNIATVPTRLERWEPRCACRCPFAKANPRGVR